MGITRVKYTIFFKVICLECLFCFFSFFANSTLLFKNYSVNDGLAQSQVFAIVQDNQGYIWIGTNGGGLSQYNGINFNNVTTDHGLSNNVIKVIIKDFKNQIWVGTDVGLNLYTNHKFKVYTTKQGLPNNDVLAIYEDLNHRIWVATVEGLCYIQNDKIVNVKLPKVDGVFPSIKAIVQDHQGGFWFGSNDGLFYYKEGKFKLYTTKNGLLDDQINKLVIQKNGQLLIGSNLGLTKLMKGLFIKNPMNVKHLINLRINEMYYDREENLWLGTDRGIVVIKKHGGYKLFLKKDGLAYERIMTIIQDSEGKFWIGNDGGGVDFFNGNLFEGYAKDNGLYQNTIWSIGQDNRGRLWFGHDDGISILDHGYFVHQVNLVHESNYYPDLNSKNTRLSTSKQIGKTVYAVYKDRVGKMWIGTESGVSIYDGKSYKHFTKKSGLAGNQIFCIYHNSKGEVWVGGRDGITIFKDYKIIKYLNKKNGLPSNRVNNINEDRLGNIWIGTDLGLVRWVNGKIEVADTHSGLLNNCVYGIQIDNKDNVWIGTYGGGVTLFKDAVKIGAIKSQKIYITKKEGLTDNEVLFLILDKKGNLFVGANKGLNKINTHLLLYRNSIKVKTYGIREGFYGLECNMNATFSDNEGELWFGTIGGAIAMNPKYDEINEVESKTNITRIRIDFKDTLLAQNSILNYNSKKITFSFIGISTSNPDKVRYRFKLDGYDDKWSPITTETSATYANLNQGEYVFQVVSCNNDGVWNKKPTLFSFKVTPPFWETYWFYSLCIVLISSVIYIYVRWREKALHNTNRYLEAKIQERTAELSVKNKELEKLSIVASETHNSVLICDAKGNMEWANTGFSKLFGYSLDEYKKLKGVSIIEASINENISQIIQESISEKKFVVYETLKTTKGGKKLHVQSTLTPILDQEENVVKLVIIDADITELKSAQVELEVKNNDILMKNKDILDSIHYAYRIQQAMLPPNEEIRKCSKDTFILFKPKDIVSGDFYWFHRLFPDNPTDHSYLIAVVDCTGHGVPGAFMSMIGNNLLNQIISENENATPDIILTELNHRIRRSLHQENISEGQVRDGMDIALCLVHPEKQEMLFSGANRSLVKIFKYEGEDICSGSDKCVISNGYFLDEISADRKSIGGFTEPQFIFTLQKITIQKGDSFYIYSDGFVDQFGENTGKKFMSKQFKQLLINIQEMEMSDQNKVLDETIVNWQGALQQVDDILVIGFRF